MFSLYRALFDVLPDINKILFLLVYTYSKERMYLKSRDICMYSEIMCLLHNTLYIYI